MKVTSSTSLIVLLTVMLAERIQSKATISNIIVLMMENRSFDHLLGWLKSDHNSKIEGLVDGKSVPRDPNDETQGSVPVTRDGYDVAPDDPFHSFDNITLQINNNAMNGFILDALSGGHNESNPVSMFDQTTAPIINTLGKEFAIFDHWHCSIPGPTDPNRAFAMSGTSRGVLTNFNGTLWDQQSYFDYLVEHDRTFAGYYQRDMWALFYFEDTNIPENSQYMYELDMHFYDHVAAGTLPHFTWLQPQSSSYGPFSAPSWQHPDASVEEGERLIKKVYEAIRAGPKWEETLFIITYDEHGGFYDHVAPPSEGVPAPDDGVADNGFAFDRLGVRIPTIAISPWIPAGTLVSSGLEGEMPTATSAFDATSIMATSNILLGLKDAEPLGARMAWANTFASLVTDSLSEPRTDCPTSLPDLPEHPVAVKEEKHRLQRAKPLNEHVEAQLIFFCARNYPEEHARGECPGRPEVMVNQGLAADWMEVETKKYTDKLRHAEKMMREKKAAK